MIGQKHIKAILRCLIYIISVSLCCACQRSGQDDAAPSGQGLYFWRTALDISAADSAYMTTHHVARLYIRFFDVVERNGAPMPQGTLRIDSLHSTLKHREIIPVVYIDVESLRDLDDAAAGVLAERLVTRVQQMCQTHHIAWHELQLDCDWTAKTQDRYFALLRDVRARLQAGGYRLSVTVRLHQLAMPEPDCDYGVLMLYNTGDFTRAPEGAHPRNPIFDMRDAAPYLRHLAHYDLPLTPALADFSWPLLYRGDSFEGILYGVDLQQSSVFQRVADDAYRAISVQEYVLSVGTGEVSLRVLPGDRVKVWRVSEQQREALLDAIRRLRPSMLRGQILFR